MKKILVYGDSNTWGDNFITNKRIPDDKQWVNLLQKKLGSNYKLLQEGLPGRVAGDIEKEKVFKNGRSTFLSTYRTNAPVDTLIIALGSNDLQIKYNESSDNIIKSLLWYKEILEELYLDPDDREKYFNNRFPEIIYILPPNFDYIDKASVVFDKNSEEKRQNIIKYFIDNNISHIEFNNMKLFDDGLHFNYEDHKIVSDRVFEVIKDE